MIEQAIRQPGRIASMLVGLGFAATIASGLSITEGTANGSQPQGSDNSFGSITTETISVSRTRITNPEITVFLNDQQITDSSPINVFSAQKPTPESDTEQAPLPEAGAQNPDIIILLIDDLPPLNKDFWERFPTIKREFIDNGITFTNARGETSLCCPGRAGLLTGLHTFHHGVNHNQAKLFKSSMTIATALDKVGYHTVSAGKYLNGIKHVKDKTPPGWDDIYMTDGAGEYNYKEYANGKLILHGFGSDDFQTDVVAKRILDAVRETNPDEPIFAVASFRATHNSHVTKQPEPARRNIGAKNCRNIPDWSPPNYNEKDVSDKPKFVRNAPPLREPHSMDLTKVCESMQGVEDMAKKLFKVLKKTGRNKNTLVFLTSDNGMAFGAHGLMKKETPDATPVPLFVRWPAVIEKGRKEREPVMNIDIAPTICNIVPNCHLGPYPTGQKNPDGVSLDAIIRGTNHELDRDAVLINHWYGNKVLGIPGWKGIVTENGWMYIQYKTVETELYKPKDRWHLNNLAHLDKYRDKKRQLRNEMKSLR